MKKIIAFLVTASMLATQMGVFAENSIIDMQESSVITECAEEKSPEKEDIEKSVHDDNDILPQIKEESSAEIKDDENIKADTEKEIEKEESIEISKKEETKDKTEQLQEAENTITEKEEIANSLPETTQIPLPDKEKPLTQGKDGIVFDMDLSEYSQENPVVKNAVTDKTDGITVVGKGDEKAPFADVISSMNGETKFITTGKTENNSGEEYGLINLDNTLAGPMAKSDELSIEFWANADEPSMRYLYYRYFKLSSEEYKNTLDDSTVEWELSTQTVKNLEHRFAKKGSGWPPFVLSSVSNFPKEKWTHYVLTRKWNESKNAWDSCVYINGALKAKGSGGVRSNSDNYSLSIGGSGAYKKTFQGSIGVFKVYNKELDLSKARELYLETKDDYFEIPAVMDIVAPKDDFEISTYAGKINIEFNNFIDVTTLDEITFIKEDGSEIPGGVYKNYEKGNINSLELTFGLLDENSTYILHIGEVKSINNVINSPRDIIVTTGENYIINEDFSGYETGVLVPDKNVPITYFSSGENNSPKDFEIKEATSADTGKKIKYLAGKTRNKDSDKDTYAAYSFPEGYDKDFVLEVGLRGNGDTVLDRSVRVYSNGSYSSIGVFLNGKNLSNGSNLKVIKGYSTGVRDEFGFMNMKYVFRKNEEGFYEVTGTSPDDPSVEFQGITKFKKIDNIRLINIYHKYSDENTVELSHVKLYELVYPKVVNTNINKLDQNSEYLEVVFGDDMQGFSEDSIILEDAHGEKFNAVFEEYDSSRRMAKLKINEYFDYGSNYVLKIRNISSKNGVVVENTDIPFKFPEHQVRSNVTNSSDHVNVTLINNAPSKKDMTVIVLSFDKDKNILKCSSENIRLSANQRADRKPDTEKTATDIKVYIYEALGNEYIATRSDPYIFSKVSD